MNKNELFIGFVFGLAFINLGPACLILAPCTAFLWALGGAKASDGGNKAFRRVGCPLIACLASFLASGDYLIFLALPTAYAVLTLGYGIPDDKDDGSTLGRFWWRICKGPFWTNFFTRGAIYLLLFLSFWPVWMR